MVRGPRAAAQRRAAIVRVAVYSGREPAAPVATDQPAAAEIPPLTPSQTIALLALSRLLIYPLQPQMRRRFLRLRLVAPVGDRAERSYQLTDAGRAALGASTHLASAQRALDGQRGG